MRTRLVSAADPLTSSQQAAMALLRRCGSVTVGQRPDPFSQKAIASGAFACNQVFLPVAKGLAKRGLVNLTRPDKRGPLVMTLREPAHA